MVEKKIIEEVKQAPQEAESKEQSYPALEKQQQEIAEAGSLESESIQKEKEASMSEKEGGEPGAPVVNTNPSYIAQKKHREEEVEDILEDDLDEVFVSMTPEKQQEFKDLGEETIHEINEELDNPKFSIKKVIALIKKWLSVVPGINKFFLEQETKIKSDAIAKMRDKS